MRKILLVGIITLLLLSGSQSLATNEEQPSYEQKTISFYQLTQLDKGSFLTVDLKGADIPFFMQNHYIVPTKIETYTFPYGTTIESVSVTNEKIHSLSLKQPLQLAPPARLLDGQIHDIETYIKSDPVALSEWFTYDIGSGIFDDLHQIIVKIQLFPVQYDPIGNIIEWTEEMTLNIKYTLPKKTDTISTDPLYNFIILTPSDFKDELQPLVDHKINRNISTKLITLTEIYNSVYFYTQGRDDQEKIKYFIKDAFEQWGTRNVLLVGGYNQFPSRYTHVYVNYGSGDSEIFVSDLYYADILDENGFCSWDSNNNDIFGEFDWGSDRLRDDVDIYPEVALGRLACISKTEVTDVVNKIIAYETAESYKKEWFSTVLYCGGDTFPGDGNEVPEGEYFCDYISNFMTGFSSNKRYVTEGTLRTTIDISDGVSQGNGFFVLAGHASPTSWATHPLENPNIWIPAAGYKNTNAATLNNGEKLPILLTESCSPFKFASSDNCIGWSFVSNPTGGTIAGFGATGLSWGYVGTSVVSGLTSKLLIDTLKAYKQDGAITPGEMWTIGINSYYRPNMDGGSHKSVEEWQFFGDPTLAIAEDSLPPNKPSTPTGPNSGKPGETYTYSTSTTDPEGDDVYYLFDWGDGTESGWIGPYDSGKTCEISYQWSSKGSFDIRVKAQDFHGAVSDWSDPLPISMPKARSMQNAFIEWLLDHFPLIQYLPFVQ